MDNTTAIILPKASTNVDYEFKYVPAEDFRRVVKTVQDKHQRSEQAHLWKNFFTPLAPPPSKTLILPDTAAPAFPLPLPSVPPFSDHDIDHMVDAAMGEIIEATRPMSRGGGGGFRSPPPPPIAAPRQAAAAISPPLPPATVRSPRRRRRSGSQATAKTPDSSRSGVDYIRSAAAVQPPTPAIATASLSCPVAEEAELRNSALDESIRRMAAEEAANAVLAVHAEVAAEVEAAQRPPPPSSHRVSRPKSGGHKLLATIAAESAESAAALLTKITTYQQRIGALVPVLAERVAEPATDDGVFDVKRRQKRFAEFLVRFNRNYLYQIGRTVDELKAFNVVSAVYGTPVSESQLSLAAADHLLAGGIHAKVCSLFALLLQATHSFARNLLAGIGADKLRQFLLVAVDAVRVCEERRIFADGDLVVRRLQLQLAELIEFVDEKLSGRWQAAQVQECRARGRRQRAERSVMAQYSHRTGGGGGTGGFGMYGSQAKVSPYAVKCQAPRRVKQGAASVVATGRRKLRTPVAADNRSQVTEGRAEERRGEMERIEEVRDEIEPQLLEMAVAEVPKSPHRLRSLDLEDVETIVQGVANEPESLANSTNEVVPQPTAASDQKRLMMDILQTITQQQVQSILTPLMAQLSAQQNPESLHRVVSALYAGCCSANSCNDTTTTNHDAGCASTGAAPAAAAASGNSGTDAGERDANADCGGGGCGVGDVMSVATPQQGLAAAAAAGVAGGGPVMMDIRLSARGAAEARQQVAVARGGSMKGAAMERGSGETNIRFCKNVHHTYIVQPFPTSPGPIEASDAPSASASAVAAATASGPRPKTKSSDADQHRAAAEQRQLTGSTDYRNRFLRSVLRKPLYMNKNFACPPWQLIGRIADETVRQAMATVEAEIDLGEADLVRAFLRNEVAV